MLEVFSTCIGTLRSIRSQRMTNCRYFFPHKGQQHVESSTGRLKLSGGHLAAASGWGLLRNVFQEFGGQTFVGTDTSYYCPAHKSCPPAPRGTDSFGTACASGVWYLPRAVPKADIGYQDPIMQSVAGSVTSITGKKLSCCCRNNHYFIVALHNHNEHATVCRCAIISVRC